MSYHDFVNCNLNASTFPNIKILYLDMRKCDLNVTKQPDLYHLLAKSFLKLSGLKFVYNGPGDIMAKALFDPTVLVEERLLYIDQFMSSRVMNLSHQDSIGILALFNVTEIFMKFRKIRLIPSLFLS
jgi:hypothetical protein